ncbi:MAG: recombinase family protein [Rhizonema sp. PD37]|nr:recombinase family protein [Rhizonema sp. PD37]
MQQNLGESVSTHSVAIEKSGKIQAVRKEGGHRRYRVADLLKVDNPNLRHTVIYGRVSTPDKKEDLERQIGVLQLYCQQQGYEAVYTLKDVGSGLNYKKRGLLKLLELLRRSGSRAFGHY